MQKALFLLLFSFLSSYVFSQKVNTKDFKVEVKYQELPQIALNPTFTTYDVYVNGDGEELSRYGQTLSGIKKSIALEGYNRVGGGGSISVKVSIGTPISGMANLLEETKTDKEGNKSKEYSYYHDLEIPSKYMIVDFKGNIIEEKLMTSAEKLTTAVYKTKEELTTAYGKAYPKELTDKLKSMLANNIRWINSTINYYYGRSPKALPVEYTTLQSKEHPDFPAYEKIRNVVETAYAALTAEDASIYAEKIQPAIDFWLVQEKKYDPNNKDERKMNYGLRQNLLHAYLAMDQNDKVAEYYAKMAAGEVSENAAKKDLEEFNKYRDRLKKLGLKGQHTKLAPSEEEMQRSAEFTKELDNIYASGDVKRFEDFESIMSVTKSSKVEPATLFYKNGTKEKGYLVYEPLKGVPDFRQPNLIRFGKAVARNTVATTLDYGLLDSMRINDKSYGVANVQLHAGILSIKFENAVVEKVKDYKRSSLVIVHPPFMYMKGLLGADGEPLVPEIYMFHKGRKQYLSTDGLSGFTKAMSKNMEDCPAAVAYLSTAKGQTDPNAPDERLKGFTNTGYIVEAMRVYDSCQ